MATYELKVDTRQVKVLLARTTGPFGSPEVAQAAGRGVRRWGVMLQTRAVFNVTGHPVIYNGRAFVVRVRTGTLRGSIELQWPFQTQFQARVFVNGTMTNPGEVHGAYSRPVPVSQYAGAIEFGHDEIDLKKTMKGKVVPFFGARAARARGPYAARGLKPTVAHDEGYGSRWTSQELNTKLHAQGKGPLIFEKKGGNAAYTGAKRGASTYFITFRRVGDTGWVIPKAEPRPFLRAALEGTAEKGRRALVSEIVGALRQ